MSFSKGNKHNSPSGPSGSGAGTDGHATWNIPAWDTHVPHRPTAPSLRSESPTDAAVFMVIDLNVDDSQLPAYNPSMQTTRSNASQAGRSRSSTATTSSRVRAEDSSAQGARRSAAKAAPTPARSTSQAPPPRPAGRSTTADAGESTYLLSAVPRNNIQQYHSTATVSQSPRHGSAKDTCFEKLCGISSGSSDTCLTFTGLLLSILLFLCGVLVAIVAGVLIRTTLIAFTSLAVEISAGCFIGLLLLCAVGVLLRMTDCCCDATRKGVRLGWILTTLLCLVIAVIVAMWLMVYFTAESDDTPDLLMDFYAETYHDRSPYHCLMESKYECSGFSTQTKYGFNGSADCFQFWEDEGGEEKYTGRCTVYEKNNPACFCSPCEYHPSGRPPCFDVLQKELRDDFAGFTFGVVAFVVVVIALAAVFSIRGHKAWANQYDVIP